MTAKSANRGVLAVILDLVVYIALLVTVAADASAYHATPGPTLLFMIHFLYLAALFTVNFIYAKGGNAFASKVAAALMGAFVILAAITEQGFWFGAPVNGSFYYDNTVVSLVLRIIELPVAVGGMIALEIFYLKPRRKKEAEKYEYDDLSVAFQTYRNLKKLGEGKTVEETVEESKEKEKPAPVKSGRKSWKKAVDAVRRDEAEALKERGDKAPTGGYAPAEGGSLFDAVRKNVKAEDVPENGAAEDETEKAEDGQNG